MSAPIPAAVQQLLQQHAQAPPRVCRHCHAGPISRPRGLCWTCYYLPGVREQYPPVSKFGHRGPGHYHRLNPKLPAPTDALPGSDEKVRVLIERAAAGFALWHPGDARID